MTCIYFNKIFTGLIDFVQLFCDKYSMDILSMISSKKCFNMYVLNAWCQLRVNFMRTKAEMYIYSNSINYFSV